MNQLVFTKDVCLMYISAESFPDDVFLVHEKLNSIVKNKENREFFGFSFPDKNGKIHYKAAVTETFKQEGLQLGLKTYLLKKGNYNYITIPECKNNISEIENAFKIFLLKSSCDENGFNSDIYNTEKKGFMITME